MPSWGVPHAAAERQGQPLLSPVVDCHFGSGRPSFSPLSLPLETLLPLPPFAGWGLGPVGWGLGLAGKHLFPQEDGNEKFVGVSASSYLGRVSRKARYPRSGPVVVNQ